MNKCIYKGYACKYASESGYCEIGNENCVEENKSILDEVDEYLDFDLFDEDDL